MTYTIVLGQFLRNFKPCFIETASNSKPTLPCIGGIARLHGNVSLHSFHAPVFIVCLDQDLVLRDRYKVPLLSLLRIGLITTFVYVELRFIARHGEIAVPTFSCNGRSFIIPGNAPYNQTMRHVTKKSGQFLTSCGW